MLGAGEIIYFSLLLISLIICVLRRKFLPWYFIFFSILLACSFLFDSTGFILKYYHLSRYWVYHLYRPLDYILLTAVFFYEIKGKIEKNIIKTSWYIFFIICLIYSLINKFTGPTSLTSTINNVFLIIICFLYFRDTFKIKEKLSLAKEPVFWIATGTLFYCLATFFSMGFLKYLRENNNPLANKYFLINYVMNYTLYLTYIIGLLCSKTYQK